MPIKETYTFSDWSSVSQMKNVVNPSLKLRCSVMVSQVNDGILGYSLEVYDDTTSEIVYKIKIDCGETGTWCLTSNEAVEMLNVIGFPCRRTNVEIIPSDSSVKTLKSLSELGFIQIIRTVRPQDVLIFGKDSNNVEPLNELLVPYTYRDWLFLPVGQILSINELIKRYEGESNA